MLRRPYFLSLREIRFLGEPFLQLEIGNPRKAESDECIPLHTRKTTHLSLMQYTLAYDKEEIRISKM